MSLERLLFASIHGYIDHSSGAALATRDVLELLAARGVDCRVLSTGILDFEGETSLKAVLDPLDVGYDRAGAVLSEGREVEVVDLQLEGVRVTLLPTTSSRLRLAPTQDEALAFLDMAEFVFDRFRPQVMLTYGGHPLSLALMACARRRGIAVVFHLHNLAYTDRRAFADATAVLVNSEFTRRHYLHAVGQPSTAIPYPLRFDRVVADDAEPRFLTFINPQLAKGVTIFARVATELDRRRPDIPLLVVEGRGKSDVLEKISLDLSGVRNLHRMSNTPEPRDFYRVSRAVMAPSLCRETFGRVAAEALANGLPVLASDRGALPQTLGDAGFVFSVPPRCTPESGAVPTPHEVAPWLATVERLWDDPGWEIEHRARARAEAKRWEPDRIAEQYLEFFDRCAHARNPTP